MQPQRPRHSDGIVHGDLLEVGVRPKNDAYSCDYGRFCCVSQNEQHDYRMRNAFISDH